VAPDACFESYEAIAAEAARLIADPARLAQKRDAARARAGELIGVSGLISRILEEMHLAP
jgi:hypothetical protein